MAISSGSKISASDVNNQIAALQASLEKLEGNDESMTTIDFQGYSYVGTYNQETYRSISGAGYEYLLLPYTTLSWCLIYDDNYCGQSSDSVPIKVIIPTSLSSLKIGIARGMVFRKAL